MKKTLMTIPMGLAALSLATTAVPQEQPPSPPKILSIYREQVKPGKAGAHEKTETAWAQAFAKANTPVHYIAMTSVTGSSEAWFLQGRENFASIQAEEEAMDANAAAGAELEAIAARDGELLEGSSHVVAIYREDLSYNADRSIPKMRFFDVLTMRVKPGHANDFEAATRLIADSHEKMKMDEHWAVFQVVSGAPDGTFLIFEALESLSEWDKLFEMHGKKFREGFGEDNWSRLRDLTREAVEYSKDQVFRLNPMMSVPSAEFVAADPFWAPKPAPASKKK